MLQPDTSNNLKPIYTCPMCPEIIKDAPGSCPKCGMDLLLEKDRGEEGNIKHDE